MNPFFRFVALGLSMALAACSILETDKVDYKSATKAPSLAVPPDLTQLSRDNRYAIPGGAVTAVRKKARLLHHRAIAAAIDGLDTETA